MSMEGKERFVSIFHRLGAAFGRAKEQSEVDEEHQAIVDLLVLTVYADERVSQEEMEALARFDVEHQDWDGGDFSVAEYLGPSIAKVRAAVGSPLDVDGLLSDAAAKITTPALRAEVPGYCEAVAQADGQLSADEVGIIAKIRRALS
jgi:uncharacterized tellurite resistance protein B-like protein